MHAYAPYHYRLLGIVGVELTWCIICGIGVVENHIYPVTYMVVMTAGSGWQSRWHSDWRIWVNASHESTNNRHEQEAWRPNKFCCRIKLTKLSTYCISSEDKKRHRVECHNMASTDHKRENQPSILRHISDPREDLGPMGLLTPLGPLREMIKSVRI